MNSKHLGAGAELPLLQERKLRMYSMRFCPFCHKVLLALAAKRIPCDIVNVNLKDKPEWLTKLNPTGAVPIIETAEGTLYESMIVMEYLDETYPGHQLLAADPFRKALDRIWNEKSSKIPGVFFALLKGVNDAVEQTTNRFKEFEELMAGFETELERRGTLYFGGTNPGILDYSLWPWFERFYIFNIAYPVYDFDSANAHNAALAKWCGLMRQDEAVKASYLVPEIHHKFILGYMAGTPDYELV